MDKKKKIVLGVMALTLILVAVGIGGGHNLMHVLIDPPGGFLFFGF